MKLKLPKNRTLEQLQNHFEVEKEIVSRLKKADKEEQKKIFKTMYDELFERVPDHPRLQKRSSPEMIQKANRTQMDFIREYIRPDAVFVEFGAGGCDFSLAVSSHVAKVFAVDIADQRGDEGETKDNFCHITYDGYEIDMEKESADIVFSNQLIEHIHPDYTIEHFQMVHRILKKGGVYVFTTPNRLNGPHDISKYFSDEAEGFHLKEWTFIELTRLLRESGFSRWRPAGKNAKLKFLYYYVVETLLALLPRKLRRAVGEHLNINISIAAFK